MSRLLLQKLQSFRGYFLSSAHHTGNTRICNASVVNNLLSNYRSSSTEPNKNSPFLNAALQNCSNGLNPIQIKQASFEDISCGLLFALFTEFGKSRKQRDAARAIVKQNRCFKGSQFGPDGDELRALVQKYNSLFNGPYFKSLKQDWRGQRKGQNGDSLLIDLCMWIYIYI